ncbi:Ca2+-transporting ATPase [Modicisalibacter ilicicola DSM 19980]|uniref:Ca2+-transporting ATPase n=1 Tax=Modicisalibacter ilicicola DSM 19980 TaxID=1121942 RepID=A0A1M4UWV1_9GAMM|nr:cation-transporting P-type ATPase [Halomonas ilicicola]SHE61103.1 Ca2+-transporting ATPase [Halomonas ilicicola DSM 19980]
MQMEEFQTLGDQDRPAAWHALQTSEALAALDSDDRGLSTEGAEARLQRFGPNRLEQARGRSALRRLLEQFHNVLIYVLLGAAAVTALLGHWVDTGVILGVVIVNALVGFLQEGKAEKALDAIKQMLSPYAAVIRDGKRGSVPAQSLVPGDIVVLKSGDRVPADLRLLDSHGLQIQEAALTGESLPVEKSAAPVAEATDLAERTSMAFSSTLVTSGRGRGVVVHTGQHTEIGRISTLLTQVTPLETPLLRQTAVFARYLTLAILFLASVTFLFGYLVGGASAADMFIAAVSLVVAAIPEGLPAIMTITLAIGVTRMARRNAIIRLLPAVETLGSVSVICSDKTGTLTRNEMTLQRLATPEHDYQASGIGYRPEGDILLDERPVTLAEQPDLHALVQAATLCNDAELAEEQGQWRVHGDPTEGAIITLAYKAGLDPAQERQRSRVDMIPFESEHKFMATLHRNDEGQSHAYVKGAPERVLEMCRFDHAATLEAWRTRSEAMAKEGMRVLAVASRPAEADQSALAHENVREGLTLLGLLGFLDPPREEAIAAVAECQRAGIRVKMITGDHATTAGAIGHRLGIGNDRGVMTGHELDGLDATRFAKAANDIDIFARTTPEHKLRLVEALQAEGQVVAMTGDGVNDAPALKRADVGVAMGRKGTEAAKEAAEMVLADDDFASITHAVEEGRTVYDNLRKALLFILPTNGGQALVIMAAILLGLTLPITPVQILWVNMITAVTLALALAFEPAEQNVMGRPPRQPDEPILSGFLVWRILFVSVLLMAGTFTLFLMHLEAHGLSVARTIAVNALVAGEIGYLLNSRRLHANTWTLDGLFGSRAVLIAIATVVGFQLLFTYLPPMQKLFDTAALDAGAWLPIGLFAIGLFLLVELEKLLVRRFRRSSTPGLKDEAKPHARHH